MLSVLKYELDQSIYRSKQVTVQGNTTTSPEPINQTTNTWKDTEWHSSKLYNQSEHSLVPHEMIRVITLV